MKPQVEEFILKQKQKQKEAKDQHLKELGLVEASETGAKQYCSIDYSDEDAISYGYVHKDEHGRFKYKAGVKAIEVSDEEYAEICTYCPPTQKIGMTEADLKQIEILDSIRKMVKFFVILAIITLVLSFFIALISIS